MEHQIKHLLVTGGAGFIGSHFTRLALNRNHIVTVIDKLAYSGSKKNLIDFKNANKFQFIEGSILDDQLLNNVFKNNDITAIINFAAETHVDRSIEDSSSFVSSNVLGVQKLLAHSMNLFRRNKNFKFVQISTDEVFGSISEGSFSENSPYKPNSPYSASKAGGDHLVSSYCKTFNFPGIITNCTNNYGQNQFPEKLVPLLIIKAIQKKKLPIYGNGDQMRDWLHVNDHCNAIMDILNKGTPGARYVIGGNNCIRNIDMALTICRILDEIKPLNKMKYENLIIFVKDRPGHDLRYSVDASKMKFELNWTPKVNFVEGLKDTIQWYINNRDWWEDIQKKSSYKGQRIGLIS